MRGMWQETQRPPPPSPAGSWCAWRRAASGVASAVWQPVHIVFDVFPPNRARICPRGSPSCMPWQLVQVSGPRMVQGDCRRPWYSYAVRRGVPSSQKRAAKAWLIAPQGRVAPERRALDRQIVAGNERIAVLEERRNLIGDPLAVAAAAEIGGARRRQARRVHDGRVGAAVRLQRPAAQRIAVAARRARRPGRGRPRRRRPARRPWCRTARCRDRAPGWARRCGRRRSCRSSG